LKGTRKCRYRYRRAGDRGSIEVREDHDLEGGRNRLPRLAGEAGRGRLGPRTGRGALAERRRLLPGKLTVGKADVPTAAAYVLTGTLRDAANHAGAGRGAAALVRPDVALRPG
jgi:hypothetical protein